MKAESRRWAAAVKYPPFIVCILVLASASVMAGPVAKWFKVALRKDPVPLRQILTNLDRSALGEYEFVHATTLDPSTVAALGTDSYLDWEFVDTSVKRRNSPLHVVRVLITYYTGKPNLVPHIPEVCHQAAGLEMVNAQNVTVEVAGLGGVPMSIPVRAVTFAKTAVYNRDRPTIVYTFNCNGKFLPERNLVRARLSNPFHKGAYFCKIELSFRSPKRNSPSAEPEETIRAAEKFLSRLLPVLLEDHLPDWEAFEKGQSVAS